MGSAKTHLGTNRSDTTVAVLAKLVYLLIHPVYYRWLQQEVDATFLRGEDPIDQDRFTGVKFLKACVNKTPRPAPPVPNGSHRGVPSTTDGKLVGSQLVQPTLPDLFHTDLLLSFMVTAWSHLQSLIQGGNNTT